MFRPFYSVILITVGVTVAYNCQTGNNKINCLHVTKGANVEVV
jgi:hypothetical protein